ncbi:unnamed protein product, partial [Choristocarpus tenellus]
GKDSLSHGLGVLGATFGLSICIGPILGGLLSSFHARAACLATTVLSTLSLLLLIFFGWEETAHQPPVTDSPGIVNGAPVQAMRTCGRVGPLSLLKVISRRGVLPMSLCLFFFNLALNIYGVWYNYMDYRYGWGPVVIGAWFSTVGLCLALMQGVVIRAIIPKILTENEGVLCGIILQAVSGTLYGLCSKGWMMYPVLVVTVL